jgi:peptidoglycan hydrolase-like protein with peptidoglycan-binding domain
VTGYFGPLTESAVKRFQQRHNIPETGIVDKNVRTVAENLILPQNVTPDFLPKLDLSVGSTGENVKILQTVLVQLGYINKDSITSYFGSITKEAVIKFQKDNSIIPAVGYAGPITRVKLIEKISNVPKQ